MNLVILIALVNVLAVVVALSDFLVGSLWHISFLFEKKQIVPDTFKKNSPKDGTLLRFPIFGSSSIASLFAAFVVAIFLKLSGYVGFGLLPGIPAGMYRISAARPKTILCERQKFPYPFFTPVMNWYSKCKGSEYRRLALN